MQKEIDDRVDAVREIWDDPLQGEDHAQGAAGAPARRSGTRPSTELKRLEADVADLEQKMAPYVAYVTGEPFTIREYFQNDAERRLYAYNRWVMEDLQPQAGSRGDRGGAPARPRSPTSTG